MASRYLNVSDVPLSLAVFLASDYYDYNVDPDTISTTTLLKPVRQIILPSRIPPGEGLVSLPDMLNNRMGAAIHDGIERAWLTNVGPAMLAMGYPTKVVERIRVNPTHDYLKPTPTAFPFISSNVSKRSWASGGLPASLILSVKVESKTLRLPKCGLT
jgi:hypothetical protein